VQPNDFEAQLYSRLVFDGLPDGEAKTASTRC
jgi:hypothetical protein